MDDHWYRYFLVAASHEHLGQAAEELGISQPALSRCIIKIEEEYGARLFDRSGRRVRLNAAGRVMQQRIGRALGELEDAKRELQEMKAELQQTVRIGFLATLGVRVIPSLVESFRRKSADAHFRLLQGSHPALQSLLMAGEIDLCISSPRFSEAKLHWEPLYEEELVLLAPVGHPLAQKQKNRNLSEFASEPFVALKRGYGLRHYLEEVSKASGFAPNIVVETEEVGTLIGLVGAGLGLALAPASEESANDRVVAIRIATPACRRTMGLSWRMGRYMPKLTTSFRDHVISVAPDFGQRSQTA